MEEIAIIGGGASGLMAAHAAACAAREAGAQVRITVLEAADRVGKSILASGNGRCNFSNAHIDAARYRNAEFVARAFAALSPEEVRAAFAEMGLTWYDGGAGWLYPVANKASSVLDVLRFALADAGVRVECGAEVARVERTRPVGDARRSAPFLLRLADGRTHTADAVVIACGGRVVRALAPRELAGAFRSQRPVLGPLRTETAPIKGLNNIRVRCRAALFAPGAAHPKAVEEGEVLFRDYGVSGVAVFNLSRFAEAGDTLALDLAFARDEAELAGELARRAGAWPARTATDQLAGLVLPAVARAALAQAGFPPTQPLRRDDAARTARALKGFALEVTGIGDARQCQVSRGGFDVSAFDPATCEAREMPGMFVTGEALDVDAPCGGYNLHWAWTSGMLAGRAAAALAACGRVGGGAVTGRVHAAKGAGR